MSAYSSNSLFTEIQLRVERHKLKMLLCDVCSESTLLRIKRNLQTPNREVINKVSEGFGITLDGRVIEAARNRIKLLDCLDGLKSTDSLAETKRRLNEISTLQNFDKGVNLQFVISCNARVLEFEKCDPEYVNEQIRKGISITFPYFKEEDVRNTALLFEESELIHTLALMRYREGKTVTAINLLKKIAEGIERSPEDSRRKEKALLKVFLTLSDCLTEQKNFSETVKVCDRGITVSLKRLGGKYTPGFAFNKAICLYNLGNRHGSKHYFYLAYFGYALLHKKTEAEKVKNEAEKRYGFSIETYGFENLKLEHCQSTQKRYGEQPLNCRHLGDFIGFLRTEAGMTLKELSKGICHESVLSKIERGDERNTNGNARGIKSPSIYILEALTQRLGRDLDLYYTALLPSKIFNEKQMRDEINALLSIWEYDEANKRIERLKTGGNYQKGLSRQFILMSMASVLSHGEDYNDDFFNLISEAIGITVPDFNASRIEQYHLTYNETVLISMMAAYHANNGKRPLAIDLLKRLKNNIDRNYSDESEKIRTYIMILSDLSKYLGLEEKYYEALGVISEGEALSIRNGQLLHLPELATNKAFNLLKLGNEEESRTYSAMAFYGAALVGNDSYSKTAFTL